MLLPLHPTLRLQPEELWTTPCLDVSAHTVFLVLSGVVTSTYQFSPVLERIVSGRSGILWHACSRG